jgi:hypothetical protein
MAFENPISLLLTSKKKYCIGRDGWGESRPPGALCAKGGNKVIDRLIVISSSYIIQAFYKYFKY